VNRKLIRTTLAEVKGRGEGSSSGAPHRERPEGAVRTGPPSHRTGGPPSREGGGRESGGPPVPQGRKKIPPAETNAEIFYYKKQMDSHTQMVIVLVDGDEVEGTIEWYDRNALKINRRGEPNIMLLKHNIKYMFKAEDRDGGGADDVDDRGDDGEETEDEG
jgi:sRNA-binding regulator protein Hfq